MPVAATMREQTLQNHNREHCELHLQVNYVFERAKDSHRERQGFSFYRRCAMARRAGQSLISIRRKSFKKRRFATVVERVVVRSGLASTTFGVPST